MRIKARGGQGGNAVGSAPNPGGKGAQLIVSVAVRPGDVFTFQVGQQGTDFSTGRGSSTPGGLPDGGAGFLPSTGAGNGAGGGGSSRVYRTIDNTETLILVAAGGGGATTYAAGGDGGATGGSGNGDTTPFDTTNVSSGGTPSAGGAGACISSTPQACGAPGASLTGGSAPEEWGGGGGGGGYFGGGAGIVGISGAGGSSWYDATRVSFIDNSAVSATGHGVIELTYTIVACEAGTFGVDGMAPCTPARRGFFVPNRLAVTDIAAPPGTYTNETGQQEVLRCAPGSYQPNEGQTSCISAQPGYYVSDIGAIRQERCPDGYTSTNPGATACVEIQSESTGSTTEASDTTSPTSPTTATAPPTTQLVLSSPSSVATTPSAPATALKTPRMPRISRSLKIGRSLVVAAKRQRSVDGLKMSISTRSTTCRVIRSNKGFLIVGIRKGPCPVVVRLSGNGAFSPRSITHNLVVS